MSIVNFHLSYRDGPFVSVPMCLFPCVIQGRSFCVCPLVSAPPQFTSFSFSLFECKSNCQFSIIVVEKYLQLKMQLTNGL